MLRFLHLSDLHFGQARHKPNDKTYEMCHVEFLDDCKKWLTGKSAGKADAVLITGDVAYSGSVEEYEIAAKALKEICAVVGTERVLIVPGNHDVDRSFVNLPELRLHEAIREASEGEESDNLYRKLLLHQNPQYDVNKKLSSFSKFVEQHGWKGVVDASKEPWFEDLEIQSNRKIRIHGLCSVFVCNDRDDVNKMVLGPTQWYSSKLAKENYDHIVMMHHPFNWLKDGVPAKKALMARMKIFLSGHTHDAGLTTIDDVMCVSAGALNPGAGERVSYSFNWLELSIVDGVVPLKVEYFPRKWMPNNAVTKFGPDGSNSRYNPKTQSVVVYMSSNYRAEPLSQQQTADAFIARAQDIAHKADMSSANKLLLLRPAYYQALRKHATLEEVPASAGLGRFIKFFRRNNTFSKEKIDLMHECNERMYKIQKGETMSDMEIAWTIKNLPVAMSYLT